MYNITVSILHVCLQKLLPNPNYNSNTAKSETSVPESPLALLTYTSTHLVVAISISPLFHSQVTPSRQVFDTTFLLPFERFT